MKHIITTRSHDGAGGFTNNAGVTRFLALPNSATRPKFSHKVTRQAWVSGVLAEASSNDILFYVHGYNTKQKVMASRHLKIKKGLAANGYKGAVVSFDWPSDGAIFRYWADRKDARKTSAQFVIDGIGTILKAKPNARVHIFAHSMGCMLVRHGFARVAQAGIPGLGNWSVQQVLFAAADVATTSMHKGDVRSKALYARLKRFTNYYSWADEILNLSYWGHWEGKVQRLGWEGLIGAIPGSAVDMYCRKYYVDHEDDFTQTPSRSHNWYFDDPVFLRDVALTVMGKPASPLPTRAKTNIGDMALWG